MYSLKNSDYIVCVVKILLKAEYAQNQTVRKN